MACLDRQEQISAYIDGELASHEMHEMTEHLKKCEHCRDYYLELKSIIESVNELEELPLPSGFHEQLMERLLEEKQPTHSWRFNYRMVNVAAIFLFVVVFAVIGINQLGQFQMKKSASPEAVSSEMATTTDTETETTTTMTMMSESADIATENDVEATTEAEATVEATAEATAEDTAEIENKMMMDATNEETTGATNEEALVDFSEARMLETPSEEVDSDLPYILVGMMGILFALGILVYSLAIITGFKFHK